MHLYNVGYHSCEDSCYVQWYHERKFTHEELMTVIEEAAYAALLASLAKPHIDDEGNLYSWQFCWSDILGQKAFEKEMQAHGFIQAKFSGAVSIFGWGSILQDDWKNETVDEQSQLNHRLCQRLRDAGQWPTRPIK